MNLTEEEVQFQRRYDEEESDSEAVDDSVIESDEEFDLERSVSDVFPDNVSGPSVSADRVRQVLRRSTREARQGAYMLALAAEMNSGESDSSGESDISFDDG